MKKLIIMLIILLYTTPAFCLSGWFEGSIFPVNDEHGIENVFIFSGTMFSFTSNVPDTVRHDRTYITNLDCSFGYVSDFDIGVGYRMENISVKILYKCQREFNGYEGDWTGVQVRYSFGE